MDFTPTEEMVAVRDSAAQIFDGMVTVERIKEIEASADRIDRDLWAELAKAHLLGLAAGETHGGSGLEVSDLCVMLREQGRTLAPVPLLTLALGALPLEAFAAHEVVAEWVPRIVEGDAIVTAALSEPGALDPAVPTTTATADGRITGTKIAVPAGNVADRVLVPAATPGGVTVFLVDPRAEGVRVDVLDTTDRQAAATLQFSNAPSEAIIGKPGDGAAVVRHILDRVHVGLAAIQLGVATEALRIAAEYTSHRLQFGKPLSTFQGVALRAADAYIDTQAMEVTMLQATWRLDNGLDAAKEVAIAKWWAAEGGSRVVHATQHLHGGMGADIDYPIHRYFLWGKQIAETLGGASLQLARLGAELAEEYR